MTNALMAGKRGLIMGLANDKSIAWGIAKARGGAGRGACLLLSGRGAEEAGRSAGRRSWAVDFVIECDVGDKASLDRLFEALKERWGTIDFVVHAIGFSDKNELRGRYVDTIEGEFPHDDEHLGLFLHRRRQRAAAMMPERRVDPDADLLRRREGHAALQRDGRGQGRAGGEREVPRRGPGPGRHPGQRDLAPGRSRRWRRAGSATSATSCGGTS